MTRRDTGGPRAGLGAAPTTGATFAMTGAVFAAWSSRVPDIKDRVGATEGDLAVVFAALNAGAIVGLLLARLPLARWGVRRVLPWSLAAYGVSLLGPAIAVGVPALCVAVGAFALLNSVVDVAMNARAVEIERARERSLLSRYHAMHSLGMIVGAGGGMLATHIGAPVLLHLGLCGLLVAGGSVAVGRVAAGRAAGAPVVSSGDGVARADGSGCGGVDRPWARSPVGQADDPVEDGGGTASACRRGWSAPVLIAGVLGFFVTVAEGAANDWTSVYLRDAVMASPTLASGGVAVFSAAMLVGRLAGDHVVARFGTVRAFRAGTLLGSVGFGPSLVHPQPVVALLGVAALGLGISYTLPTALRVAARSGPDEGTASAAVARASMLAYLGSFAGPLAIGPIAAASNLSLALGVAAAAVAAAFLTAGGLHRADTPGPERLNASSGRGR